MGVLNYEFILKNNFMMNSDWLIVGHPNFPIG